MRAIKILTKGIVLSFALAGFILVSGFFAVRLKLTNVPGIIDPESERFEKNETRVRALARNTGTPAVKGDMTVAGLEKQIDALSQKKKLREENYCKIRVIGERYPKNASIILKVAEDTASDPIVTKMVAAAEMSSKDDGQVSASITKCTGQMGRSVAEKDFFDIKDKFSNDGRNLYEWANDDQWDAIRQATIKEKEVIDRVAQETGIESRMIVSNMVVEQLRLFHSQREVFKKFFEPLKILCSANKISLGVMGIKEATAEEIERHLKDDNSPYYLGKEYENKLDFSSKDIAAERYRRLVDDKDHYYSYLYGALYLRQFEKQWKEAGFDIDYRPEVLGTLFNVGFPQSKPKPDPKVGGSQISIGKKPFSFGSLVYQFYYSGELLEYFPYEVN